MNDGVFQWGERTAPAGAPGEAGEDEGGDGEAVDHVKTQGRAGRGLENNTNVKRAQGVR